MTANDGERGWGPATSAEGAGKERERGWGPATSAEGAGKERERGWGPATSAEGAGGAVRLTAWVRGRVQGVGMRWWIRSRALELGLSGWAANLEDGRVEVVAEGDRAACERLLGLLGGDDTPGRVGGVTERWSDARGLDAGFAEK